MKTIILKVDLTKEEDGRWSASIPTLPGCSSWGYSEQEALANIKDAADIYIEDMIDEGKKVLEALGIPVIQAPSEGEALAAQMAREGLVWASASQDNDSLLYNCPRMIRNLSISGRRRVSRSRSYKTIQPVMTTKPMLKKLIVVAPFAISYLPFAKMLGLP